jgi:hypothetical protein
VLFKLGSYHLTIGKKLASSHSAEESTLVLFHEVFGKARQRRGGRFEGRKVGAFRYFQERDNVSRSPSELLYQRLQQKRLARCVSTAQTLEHYQ